MSLIDIFIPLTAGIVLIAIPQSLLQKLVPAETAANYKNKLRKIGYVLIGVGALYFFLMLAQPHR
jgi:uncharacterized protein YjeT (DUF2065 family)